MLKNIVYLQPLTNNAKVAQLVERQPSKLNVASSNLVFRSKVRNICFGFFFCYLFNFSLSPNKNRPTIIAPITTIIKGLFVITLGLNINVSIYPPIAPPK